MESIILLISKDMIHFANFIVTHFHHIVRNVIKIYAYIASQIINLMNLSIYLNLIIQKNQKIN